MFHPDAFNGTTKEFQAYVIRCGKYGIAAALCVFVGFASIYVFPNAYDPNVAFSFYDLVAYGVVSSFFALSLFLIYKMTKIKCPIAYDKN